MTSFEEQLVRQLIGYGSSLEQTAPDVLKTIVEAGRIGELESCLVSTVAQKDAEIERLCSNNYRSFVKSIDTLLGLRTEATMLLKSLRDLQQNLAKTGQHLYDARVALHEGERVLFIGIRSISALKDCLTALETAQKVILLAADGEHTESVRNLLYLRDQLLPRIESLPPPSIDYSSSLLDLKGIVLESPNFTAFPNQSSPLAISSRPSSPFSFNQDSILSGKLDELTASSGRYLPYNDIKASNSSKNLKQVQSISTIIRNWLPGAFDIARSHAREAVRWWLEVAHDAHQRIGELAFEKAHRKSLVIDELKSDYKRTGIDMTDLLRAFHIFELLGERLSFEKILASDRRAQAIVILESRVSLFDINYSMSSINLGFNANVATNKVMKNNRAVSSSTVNSIQLGTEIGYDAFLYRIVGFFTIEHALLSLPHGHLYPSTQSETLWNMALKQISSVIMNFGNNISESTDVISSAKNSESVASEFGKNLESSSTSVEKPCVDANACIRIKCLNVLFLRAMQSYGQLFNPTVMLDTLTALLYRFVDITKASIVRTIHEAFPSTPITKMPVNEAPKAKLAFSFLRDPDSPYHINDLATSFCFSRLVLLIGKELASFIIEYYSFLDGIPPQQGGDADDLIRVNVDSIASESLIAYAEILSKINTVEEAIQSIVDIECLRLIFIQDLPVLLSHQKNSRRSRHSFDEVAKRSLVPIGAESKTLKTLNLSEDRLLTIVNNQMDAIFISNPYNCVPKDASAGPNPAITRKLFFINIFAFSNSDQCVEMNFNLNNQLKRFGTFSKCNSDQNMEICLLNLCKEMRYSDMCLMYLYLIRN